MEATILTALLAIGISALVVIRLNNAEQIGDEFADGDWPAVPEGLRGHGGKPGGGGDEAAPALRFARHSHHDGTGL
jgi:hypothetical protein